MKRKILLAGIVCGFALTNAQIKENKLPEPISLKIKNTEQVRQVNLQSQISVLKNAAQSSKLELNLPSKKSTERFVLVERELLSPELKAKFPNIKSYYGYSLDNPRVKITASYSPSKGLSALMYGGKDGKVLLSLVDGDNYALYDEGNLAELKSFDCGTPTESAQVIATDTQNKANPNTYRKYRLAVATDYEYNLYHAKGGTLTAEKSLAAVVESLSILSPIYENDLSISFQLINNLGPVTFLTKASDPFTTTNLNSQTQTQLDTKIGAANYDLGILFTNKVGGGNAGAIGSVCKNGSKGLAYIGYIDTNIPEGFSFAVAAGHEMGHQFGANHTHARFEDTGANREIGSGVTVMGYPGVTGTHDVKSTFIPEFFNNSLVQINNYLSGQTCGTSTPSTNNIPAVNAGSNYNIPKGTAFKLTGSATDADANDVLSYSWEQNDPLTVNNGGNFTDPSATNLSGANYRIYAPSDQPTQYFPPIKDVLNANLTSNWNQPSLVSKTMNFVLSVRDNKAGGGQTGSAAMKVNVTNNAPFKITNINLNQTIRSGEAFELKWNVSGTNSGSINAQNVKISLTNDDGQTFTTLVASTANDGSEFITIPSSLKSKKANIIVEAIGNIFYAASPVVAIDYEVSLSCKEYYTPSVDIPDQNYVDQNLVINDSTEMIEDISVITDITHPWSGDIAVFMGKSGVENMYRPLIVKGCFDVPYPQYTFNLNGGSLYNNCNNPQSMVQPMNTEYFNNYIGKPVAGTYYFRVYDTSRGDTGKINKLGVKVCRREATEATLSTHKIDIYSAKVFPNPSNGNFNVRYTSASKTYKLEIYNMAGQVIANRIVDNSSNGDNSFNFSNLAKGIYILKIIDGENINTQKLIIK